MASQDRAASIVNVTGTDRKIDAQLTSPDSPDVHGWQPIDTAPKDGTKFLGITKSGRMKVDWLDVTLSTSQFAHERGDNGYTHWHPLPLPPGSTSA